MSDQFKYTIYPFQYNQSDAAQNNNAVTQQTQQQNQAGLGNIQHYTGTQPIYPRYQYNQHQIQGLTEAIIGYALYENGLPKEQHESFIGKHHVKIFECYHKDNYTTTLTRLKELVKQLKFDGEMSSLLDD